MNLSTPILGTGAFTAADIDAAFARYGTDPMGLGAAIISQCEDMGINADVFACQIADETAWWTSEDAIARNNPAGFGHTDGAAAGTAFPSVLAGIHVCAAHLLTYAMADNPLKAEDPRYDLVPLAHRGAAHTVGDLGNGIWASAPDYSQAILNRFQEFVDNGAPGGQNIDGGRTNMRIILSAGHLNIGQITADKIGSADVAALSEATGALGTEAQPNEAVVQRAAQTLGLAGVMVLTTDAIFHPEVYDADADLLVFVHHDGVPFPPDPSRQHCGADVVHSGPSTPDVDARAQQFVDIWKADQAALTGITDTSTDTTNMSQYYGGFYRTANTPAALVECAIWGSEDGQEWPIDTDAEGDALAAAIAKFLGVTADGTLSQGTGTTDGSGTNDQQGSANGGTADAGTIPLAGGAFTAHSVVDSGDGRGVTIRDERLNLEFRIGHGFFDEWLAGDPAAALSARLDAALADDGAPLTNEWTCVHPLVRSGQPTTVQFFERARYEWDSDSGVVTRGRVGAEAMSRFQALLPPGSGHAA